MSKRRLAFENVRLLDPESGMDQRGEILIENGMIAAVGERVLAEVEDKDSLQVIDGRGSCLAPGFIDMRIFLPGIHEKHKETLRSASEAAVAGGVTTFVCSADTEPAIDSVPVLDSLVRRGRDIGLCNVLAYASITQGVDGEHLTEMGLLRRGGCQGFMDGRKPLTDARVMLNALRYTKMLGACIMTHPEEPNLTRSAVMNAGELATRMGLIGSPPVAEVIMVQRDLKLAEITGGHLHICHVSTADAVQAVREAKAKGIRVTCDTAPHYFALNDLSISDFTRFTKVNPPLRSEEDRLAIVDGLADGTIDAVASDHCPQVEDSTLVTVDDAAFGVIGLETLWPLLLEQVNNDHISLLAALAKVTQNPAKILGLNAGRLAPKAVADLVLFNMDESWVADKDTMQSHSRNTPYHSRPLQGRVLLTLKGGKVVYNRQQKKQAAPAS